MELPSPFNSREERPGTKAECFSKPLSSGDLPSDTANVELYAVLSDILLCAK